VDSFRSRSPGVWCSSSTRHVGGRCIQYTVSIDYQAWMSAEFQSRQSRRISRGRSRPRCTIASARRRPELPPRYNATETQGYCRHDGLEDGSLGDRRLCRGPLEFSIALSGSLKRAVQTPGGRPGSARAPSFGNQPARGVRYGGLRSGSVKRVAAAVGEGAQVVPELNDAQMKVLLMALEFETSGVSTTTTRTRV
jgi:hypothetical protein